MNQPHGPFTNFRDFAHAAILLILVPIVFYGGYQLVSRTASSTDDGPPDLVKDVPEVLNQAKDFLQGRSSPPPGILWIEAIDRQKTKLSLTTPTDKQGVEQKSRIAEQLSIMRQHCEKFSGNIHDQVSPETALGQAFQHLVNEVTELQESKSQTHLPRNWEKEFSALESQRKMVLSSRVDDAFRQQAATFRQAHGIQLSKLARHNREVTDELQRTLDRISEIERGTREDLAKQHRLAAFTKDENEISRLLKPFTTPAYSQLGEDWNDWKKTAEKKPLSYRDLERLGALSSDIRGIRILARIGAIPAQMYPNSARPLGSFPPYFDDSRLQPSQLETIKRAQQLIKQHSVYLIEAGLLQP